MWISYKQPQKRELLKIRSYPARKFAVWKVKSPRMWRDLCRVPKEDLLIAGMFAAVITMTIWLAMELL